MTAPLARRTLSLLPPLFGVAAIVAAAPSVAQAAKPTIESRVDRPVVGLGEVVAYSLVLRSDGELHAESASPGKLEGFEHLATQQLPEQSIVKHNGIVEVKLSLTITFRLRAKKLGKHVLGPGAFRIGGKTVNAPAVKVEVVPPGAAPPPPAPKKRPLFHDPFDDLFFQDDDEPPPPPEPPPVSDPLASLDEVPLGAGDPFVRLAVDETRPVIGQQVTAKVYAYTRRSPKIGVRKPPVFTDFRNVPLGAVDKTLHPISIGGEPWRYAALEAWAIFPLRLGTLEIGPAEVESGLADPFGGTAFEREHKTLPLAIEVVEPPLEGRPAAYVLGDVVAGLELEADVAPRAVKDGHAVVTLRMKGAGRLDPLRPILPTPQGIAWTSTYDDTRTTVDDFVVHGARKSTFDARFDREGEVELGDAVVHVWDPAKHAYVTARAPLGKVTVQAKAPDVASASTPALATLPPARATIGARGDGATIADRAWTWALVAGAPLGVVALQGISLLARRRRERLRASADAPGQQARAALAEARRAASEGRTSDAIGAFGRALDRALEEATGIRARGLTRPSLARALEGTALAQDLQGEITETFDALEAARFAAGEGPDDAAVTRVVERVLSHAPAREAP